MKWILNLVDFRKGIIAKSLIDIEIQCRRSRHDFQPYVFWVKLACNAAMRIATQLMLLLLASHPAAHDQHFHQVTSRTIKEATVKRFFTTRTRL
ncbi:hypothetical protein BDD14_6286 [Edaphobacter modestus]|uniref:Uncharacterized protein n=1 Tax=Edaphobacter modestus TaxID=388466 RepID=A0A4Q7XZ32_9BACT|nr:hypothetical protein BDD14_6286 [Edaphobacter modestus]